MIDGQGNFGSIDGDPAAAYRYTECRLDPVAEQLLADITRDTVDFVQNFDESTEEPVVLPAMIPGLLVNGASGIAVGMATNIPPHNLREVIDAAVLLINKPQTTLEQVLKIIPAPDFPTGAHIYGRAGIKEAYRTGRGSFTMRAKAAIERPARDKQQIVITEIPYQVNKSRVIERTARLVQEKKIEGISDIRDESDRDGMRIVIELKRGEQPEIVLNNLYKHTQLQESFGMIMLAIVEGRPRVLSLVEMLQIFLEHRATIVRRRTQYDLRKAQERSHILEGYKKALGRMDAVIKLIRAAPGPKEAKQGLMTRFKFSDRQSQAILELQLQRLTALERGKIDQEYKELQQKIARYEEILGSEKVLKKVIVAELEEVKRTFGDERRTEIIEEQAEINLEDLIPVEDVVITVSHSGFMKRTPLASYRQQVRGGKGRLGMKTRAEDFVERLFVASTHSYILVYSNTGKVHWLKVYEIPDIGAAGRGKHITSLVNLADGEKVAALVSVRKLADEEEDVRVGKETYAKEGYVVLATRKGRIKKTRLAAFSNPMARGIIAMGIETDDELIAAKLSTGRDIILLASHKGMAIRFPETDVRGMGRAAQGVRGMDLSKGDRVIAMQIVGEDELILSVTENGLGKRTSASAYRLQSRGGRGVINVKVTQRNGNVVGVLSVGEESEIMVISSEGKISRLDTEGIRAAGRSTQGVRVMRLDENDHVAAVCLARSGGGIAPNGGAE